VHTDLLLKSYEINRKLQLNFRATKLNGALGEPVLQKNYLFAASRNLGKSIKYLFLINFYATSDDVTVIQSGMGLSPAGQHGVG
jgi:hypothetical protein